MQMIFENLSFKGIRSLILMLSILAFIGIGYINYNNSVVSVFLGIDLAIAYYYITFGFFKKSSTFAQNAMVGGFFVRLTLFTAFIFLLRKLEIFNIFALLISFVAVHALMLPLVVTKTTGKLS
jgi:hypothetical protein